MESQQPHQQPDDSSWHDTVTEALARNNGRLTNLIKRHLHKNAVHGVSAMDVLQEVAVTAYRTHPQSVSDWNYWLTQKTRCALLRFIRAERKVKSTVGEPDRPADQLPPSQQHEHTPSRIIRALESCDALHVALNALRPQVKIVVELSQVDGLPRREIAQRIGKSERMVRSLLDQGMNELRIRLQHAGVSISTIGEIDAT